MILPIYFISCLSVSGSCRNNFILWKKNYLSKEKFEIRQSCDFNNSLRLDCELLRIYTPDEISNKTMSNMLFTYKVSSISHLPQSENENENLFMWTDETVFCLFGGCDKSQKCF